MDGSNARGKNSLALPYPTPPSKERSGSGSRRAPFRLLLDLPY